MAKPEFKEKAQRAGFQVIGGGPDVLRARVAREVAFNRDIITRAGIAKR
jgi:tripartite-type tricarboxylate transporter receptor subunit TctC